MSKIGVEVQIDVSKIDKERLFVGKKGTYLTMTTFIDTQNKDQFDNNGFISHKQTKEESDNKTNTPILGNVKVFWSDEEAPSRPQATQVDNTPELTNDDIPF